jgi:hypothetical protein
MEFVWLLWVSAFVLVPGTGAAFAAYGPGRVNLPTRLALIFGLGFALTGGAGFLLTILRVMHPVPFFALVAVGTAAVWVVAARRWSLRDQLRALSEELRGDPWTLGVGLAVLVGFAVLRLGFLGHFPVISPFRYWVDGLEIADIGRIPAASLQYGRLYPPATSKVYLNAFNAGISFAVARDSVAALRVLLWVGSVGVFVALWAVGRELGFRLTAILLPVLVVANRVNLNREMTVDLASYKAEIFGRMLAFTALAMAIRALRERQGWTDAMFAGGMFAVAAGTHLVPVLAALAMLGGYGVARLVIDREVRRPIQHAAVMGLVAGILAAGILYLPRGDIGFQGAQSPGQYQETGASFDETQYLYTGKIRPLKEHGLFYIPPKQVWHGYVVRQFNLGPKFPRAIELGFVVAGLAIALAVVMLIWFPTHLRAVGFTGIALAAGALTIALVFSFRYDVYVPAWFGMRRLFDYNAIPIVLIGLGLIEAGLLWLRRVRSWLPVAAAVVLVIGISAWIMPSSRAKPQEGTDDKAVELVNWIRRDTPCDARLLLTQRTVGLFKSLTGRVVILEGMGPFLRPDILSDVVDLALDARAFFADPISQERFLSDQGVDYVIVPKGFRVGYGGPIGRVPPGRLDGVPFLRLVVQSPAFNAYQVLTPASPGRFVDPTGKAGYRCLSEPVSL